MPARRGDPAPTFDDFDVDALLFGLRSCSRCGAEKPANSEHFPRDNSGEDGLKGTCRECVRKDGRARPRDDGRKAKRMRERYANDPALRARILARKRLYRERARAAS